MKKSCRILFRAKPVRFLSIFVVLGAVLTCASSCGGAGGFALSSEDNDPIRLKQVLAKMDNNASSGPINRFGVPMVYLVAKGKPKKVIAYDLTTKKERWRVDADVASKIVVGRDFISFKEGNTLIGLDIGNGSRLWKHSMEGTFVGATADADRVYYTEKTNSRTWALHALVGKNGSVLWDTESNGALGTPAARGGLVFSPFLKQWLTILDGRVGTPLTRIRSIDEEVSFVRATTNNVYFGSKKGVFLLDEKAASGKRSASNYGSVQLPTHFSRSHYHWDSFDPIQAGYSAYDRNRILWQAKEQDDGFSFTSNLVTVQNYRFFFGFKVGTDKSAKLAWAYSHPRVDIVASSELGGSIGIVSILGELGALDANTGKRLYEAKVKGQIIGATFDAMGWSPTENMAALGGTAAALASIANDRDARFNDVKKFAVTALSELKGGEVSRDLLALIQNKKTPPYLRETATDVLVKRKDVNGLLYLLPSLESKYNYVTGAKPSGIGAIARAIVAFEGKEVDEALRVRAVKGLGEHLFDPSTATGNLVYLAKALGTLGKEADFAILRSFLLTYRADPDFAASDSLSAIMNILFATGAASERELLTFLIDAPNTLPILANHAQKLLLSQEEETAISKEKKSSKEDSGKNDGKSFK